MSGVLVIAETRRGAVREVSLELVEAGRTLSAAGAGPLRVAVVAPDPERLASGVAAEGVDEVVGVRSGREHPDAWTMERAADRLLDEVSPSVVLVGHTSDGQGYAPAVAARRGLGFASNVVSLQWDPDGLRAARGIYGDRLLATVACTDATSLLLIRPGAFEVATGGADVAIRVLELETADASPIEHLGFIEPEMGDVDISNAPVLVSIGRGVEDRESIPQFEALADALGGTLTSSRPLVDAGWMPSSRQVGQSGKSVKAKVYIALGISGAIQHLAGIRDAETIIAINTDPRAPIFQVAQYGAVADLFAVADALRTHLET